MLLSPQEIQEDFLALENWPEKYEYIIDLGLKINDFPEFFRKNENLVKGCSSKVWLGYEKKDNILNFYIDSDSMMVKGLLYIILSLFNNKTTDQILKTNETEFVTKLDLKNHLTLNRLSGIEATIKKIKLVAKQSL